MPIPVQTGPFYEVQVIMRPDMSPNANSFVNRFFFQDIAAVARDEEDVADSIKTILDDAYNSAHAPGSFSVASQMSGVLDPSLTVYKIYDLKDTPPRSPIQRSASTWTVDSTRYPNEVALVMSYRTGPATLNGGSADPTKRGRTYFGPLGVVGISTAGNDDVYPTDDIVESLLGFGTYLMSDADMATEELAWMQYSAKNNVFDDVDGGFVDRRFDTQRRRGSESLSRETF